MRKIRPLLIIIGAMAILTLAGIFLEHMNASSDGSDPPPKMDAPPVEPEKSVGFFHAQVEIRDDLHGKGFFAVVETYPAGGDGEWPVIKTVSHTAETLGYKLIEIRGISMPSQFADRSRPLIFSERERDRFDKAMSFMWALISQCETLILSNPVAHPENGTIVCDVAVRIGGHNLDLAHMLIADGHARPAGLWDWGARDVFETTLEITEE